MSDKFAHKYEQMLVKVRMAFEHVRIFREVPLTQLQAVVQGAIAPVLQSSGILEYLHKVQTPGCYTYRHSLNVAIISGIIGKCCNYQGRALAELIMAGLLHDIGKLRVPSCILDKPSRLTENEMEEIRKHPAYGYELLKKACLSEAVKTAVLQHHERKDGSGYPGGRKQGGICDYAGIIAVADIYDAMTTNRVYRSKQTPLLAAEVLLKQMYDQLEQSVCERFMEYIKFACIGASVRLSNGQTAEILQINQCRLCHPTVKTPDGTIIQLETGGKLELLEFL